MRAGRGWPALLAAALAATALASCYSSGYRRELGANVALLSDLANKLADYCRHDFSLDDRPVSSEEMGEFYYALGKARSWAAVARGNSGRGSYRAFQLLMRDYGDFVRAADRYRLSGTTNPAQLAALLAERDRVRRQAAAVRAALRTEQ